MGLSGEERGLIGAALFMCAIIVCFNAFDSAYVGKRLVNAASPINHTISSDIGSVSDYTLEDVQSQAENVERVIPSYSEPETEVENNNSLKVININTASASELKNFLPGIGDVKAQAIVDYRESIGGFTSVSQLLNVKGIGDKTYKEIRDLCTVE